MSILELLKENFPETRPDELPNLKRIWALGFDSGCGKINAVCTFTEARDQAVFASGYAAGVLKKERLQVDRYEFAFQADMVCRFGECGHYASGGQEDNVEQAKLSAVDRARSWGWDMERGVCASCAAKIAVATEGEATPGAEAPPPPAGDMDADFEEDGDGRTAA